MIVNPLRNKLVNKIKGGEPIIAVYLTLGYPNLDKSIEAMVALAQNGADIVEIGIPFSDPIADGPIIQQSSTIALRNGIKFNHVWQAIQAIKQHTSASPIIMTYGNLVMQQNIDEFIRKSQRNGLEGLILPDIPPELYEKQLFKLNPIFLIAPNSSNKRVKQLSSVTGGFLYVVSKLDITGREGKFDPRINKFFQNGENEESIIPKLLGFGISTQNAINDALELGADGVIIGSALIKQLRKEDEIGKIVDYFKSITER